MKEFDESSEVQKIAIEHSIRRVIGANYGHKPTVTLAKAQIIDKDGKLQETDKVVGINVVFHHKNDCDSFAKLLDFKEYSYIRHLQNKDRAVMEKLMPNKHTVFMSTDQANKFIKGTLQIKIDSVEQLGTRLVKS